MSCHMQSAKYSKCGNGATNKVLTAAVKRGGNNLNGFNDLLVEDRSSQGQNLAVAGLFVSSSLDSGMRDICTEVPRS